MKVLTESQIEQIKEGTEDILENTGFVVESETILKLAGKAGAVVDESRSTIKFPRKMLRELLSLAPAEYAVSDLDGNKHTIGGKNRYCLAIVTDPWIIDYQTQRPRRPSMSDIRRNTIVGQSLPQVISMSRMDFPVTDYADATSSLRALEEHLLHQNKHIFFMAGSLDSYRQFKEIAQILAGENRALEESNILSVAVAVVSPLLLGNWNAELLLDACGNNFPITGTVCPMAGTTSPYSKTGTLLQANAENIFLLALAQLIKPGTPFRYQFGASVSDMKTGHDRYYTLDKIFWAAASPMLAASYNLPSGVECGGTMPYSHDIQSGAEGMLFMKTAYESGTNLLQGIGSCYNAIGMSAEMMIIQTAWLEASEYISRGMGFEGFDSSLESIKKTGPARDFLTDELTIKNLRSGEFFSSELFDMSGGNYEGKSMLEKAHVRVEELVAGFKYPLKSKTEEKLKKYFHDFFAKMR